MKNKASLNLLIVDSPIDSKALTGHLMLRATSTGLKVYDATGSEMETGGGTVDLSSAVMRYPATVDPETRVVSVTDGTPVEDIRIGDEIVTADGVYQKTKDSITTGSIPDDGSHILVSGCTDPDDVNGIYVATGEPNTWKNETSNNWISRLDGYGGGLLHHHKPRLTLETPIYVIVQLPQQHKTRGMLTLPHPTQPEQ